MKSIPSSFFLVLISSGQPERCGTKLILGIWYAVTTCELGVPYHLTEQKVKAYILRRDRSCIDYSYQVP